MKVKFPSFIVILLTLTYAQRPPIDQHAHSFSGVFSLNWTTGYCYAMKSTQNECDHSMLQLWDSKSLSIHGLWPSPQTQRTYENFKLSHVTSNKRLLKQMWNLMPPQTNYPIKGAQATKFNHYWLWQHEFDKHGKDFLNILQVFYPQKYKNASTEQLQQTYFTYAVDFYDKKFKSLQKIPPFTKKLHLILNLDRSQDFILTKDDFARLMNIPTTNFHLVCEKDDVLSELRICWRMQATTGIYDINCKIIQNQTIFPLIDACPQKFRMLQYGKYGRVEQKRVWRTPSKKRLSSSEVIDIA